MAAEIELKKINEYISDLVAVTEVTGAYVYGINSSGASIKIAVATIAAQGTDYSQQIAELTTKCNNNTTLITALQSAVNGKAAANHTHAIADVTDLATALAGKSNTGHTHGIGDVENLSTVLAAKANNVHTHTISQVEGLQTALDGKAAASHTHSIANVSGLQDALDGKAAANHTHAIANVSGLQDALNGINGDIATAQQDITDAQRDITDLNTRVNTITGDVTTLANNVTTAQQDITDLETRVTSAETDIENNTDDIATLQTAVEGKSDKGHTHEMPDVEGLSATLQDHNNRITALEEQDDDGEFGNYIHQVEDLNAHTPTAGQIVQYVGNDARLNNGHFYKSSGSNKIVIHAGETYYKITAADGRVLYGKGESTSEMIYEPVALKNEGDSGVNYVTFFPNTLFVQNPDAQTRQVLYDTYRELDGDIDFENYNLYAFKIYGNDICPILYNVSFADEEYFEEWLAHDRVKRMDFSQTIYGIEKVYDIDDETGDTLDTYTTKELTLTAQNTVSSSRVGIYPSVFLDGNGKRYYVCDHIPVFTPQMTYLGFVVFEESIKEDTFNGGVDARRTIIPCQQPIFFGNSTYETLTATEDFTVGVDSWQRWDVQPRTTVASGDAFLTLTNDVLGASIDIAYNSNNQHLELKGKNAAVVSYVDMGIFIKDGMLDNVELFTTAEQGVSVQTPYLKFTFNTASGKSVIRISLHDLVDVYDGANINLTSAFVKASTYSAPAIGDSMDVAIGKLLRGHEDNAAAIETKQATIVGAAATITADNLTASRALVSNASGKVAVSDTTADELGYVHGTKSNIQQQINSRATSNQGGYADSALQTVTASGSGYVTLMAGQKSGNNGAKTQALSASLTVQALATADAQHQGLAEASDVKAALNSVAAGGLKLVDLTTYQGTRGEIVKHNGATTAQYVNGYDYKCVAGGGSLPSDTLCIKLNGTITQNPDEADVLTLIGNDKIFVRTSDAPTLYHTSSGYSIYIGSKTAPEVGDAVVGTNSDYWMGRVTQVVSATEPFSVITSGGRIVQDGSYSATDCVFENSSGIKILSLTNYSDSHKTYPETETGVSFFVMYNDTLYKITPESAWIGSTDDVELPPSWQQWNSQPPVDISGKQDTLTFDDVPTDGSSNPVTSDGLYDELRIVNTPTLTVGNTTYPIVYLDADEFQFLGYDYWDTWHEVYVIPHLDDDKAYVIRNIVDSRHEGEAKQVMFSNSGNFIIKFEDINSVSVQSDYVGYLRIYSDTGYESSYHVGEDWISMNVSSDGFNVTNNDGEGGTNDNDTTIPYYGIESDSDITTIQNAVEDIPSGSGSLGVVTLKEKVLELESNKQDTLTFDNTPTTGSTNPVTSAGIKAAIDVVSQSAAQGLKCVDLSTYQGTTVGEIVKHVGATTVDYTNGYDYKYNSTSSTVPILTLTDVDVSLSDLVPASQDTASAWTSLRTPFYIHRTYDTEEEDSHSNAYHLIFPADSESIDENNAMMIGYNLDIENPTVQVGDWVYIYVEYGAPLIPDQVVSINGTKFTTESGRVYDTTSFDYYDYLCWLINEDGEEVVLLGSPMYSDGSIATDTFIYPKLHLSDRVTYTVTRYEPDLITVTIYSTTTTSSWVQTDAQPPAVYTAGIGLKLSNNQFSLNVPRVSKSCNSLPGKNTAIIEEYTNGNNYNLPTEHYYHILTMQGTDITYATQLALCESDNMAYYRNYNNGVWSSWLRLDNPTVDATPTASSTNPVQSGGTKTYVDNAVATKSNVVIRQWVTE